MSTALYLRVSSELQAEGYGLEAQETACRRYADHQGLAVARVYRDTISGTTETRAGLEELLQHSQRYKAVVIFAVDRLARSVPVAYALLEELRQAGLEVHSAYEGILNLDNDGDALRFGLHAVIADFERRRITKRMYLGKLEKARQGIPVRPLTTYGHPDNPQATQMQQNTVLWIFNQASHMGTYAIAKALEEQGIAPPKGLRWRRTTIHHILSNPTYIGKHAYGKKGERIEIAVKGIVDPAQFERVQAMLKNRNRTGGRLPGTRLDTFPLQRHIFCSECGGAMSGLITSYPYYYCRRALHRQDYAETCTHTTCYRADTIHQVVQSELKRIVLDPQAATEATRQPQTSTPNLEPDKTRLRARLERWKAAYADGTITLEEFRAEKKAIEQAMTQLQPRANAPAAQPTAILEALAATLDQPLHLIAQAANLRVIVRPGGELKLEIG